MRRARQHGWNDVYTFTKAMGEQLLVKHRGQVPLAIVRPSVTEGALEDPHPGWIHGLKVTDPLVGGLRAGDRPGLPSRRRRTHGLGARGHRRQHRAGRSHPSHTLHSGSLSRGD